MAMVFKSMYELTEFFGKSPATFYNAQRVGSFELENGKLIDMENPANWNYFFKHAKGKGLDYKDFFGPDFDESKVQKPTRNRTITKPKEKKEVRFQPEENTATPGKQSEKEKVTQHQTRKIVADALLREEQVEFQKIKNKKAMGGLIDKDIVDDAFKKMLTTLESTIKGSAGKGPGERLNNLSTKLKDSTTRERIIGFQNEYSDMIQEAYNEFVQLFKQQLMELEKAGNSE